MTLDQDGNPRQSGSRRRPAVVRLGVLATGVLVAVFCWCQISNGTGDGSAPESAASALPVGESSAEQAQSVPDAPLPTSFVVESPPPATVPTGPEEAQPVPDAPLPALVAEDLPAPADMPSGPDEPEAGAPGAASEHEGAKIVAWADIPPAPAVEEKEPAAEPGASPNTETEAQADPPGDQVASVMRIVSSVEAPSDSGGDAQPAGPPAPAPPGATDAEVVATPESKDSFEARPIGELTVNIRCRKGDLPTDFGGPQLARMQAKGRSVVFDRNWPTMGYCWDAPGLCYNPLYFEEVNLERYGYGPRFFRVAQPIISAGQFFVTVPALPYLLAAEPSRECVYTLGHYRPGSDVPYRIQLPPLSVKGGVVEAGLAVGLIYLIP
jgi:hypothetical protein